MLPRLKHWSFFTVVLFLLPTTLMFFCFLWASKRPAPEGSIDFVFTLSPCNNLALCLLFFLISEGLLFFLNDDAQHPHLRMCVLNFTASPSLNLPLLRVQALLRLVWSPFFLVSGGWLLHPFRANVADPRLETDPFLPPPVRFTRNPGFY